MLYVFHSFHVSPHEHLNDDEQPIWWGKDDIEISMKIGVV